MCYSYLYMYLRFFYIISFYFVYLISNSIFRVANQIPIIHMGRSRRWGCLVVWFWYQLMARLDGRTVAPSWPGPYEISQYLVIYSHKMNTHYACIKFYTNRYVCVYHFILHHTFFKYKSFCLSNLTSVIYMYHLKIMLIYFHKTSLLYAYVQEYLL